MKKTLAMIFLLVCAACSTPDMAMLSGGTTEALDYMQGSGQLKQGADGKQSFVFVVPAEDSTMLGLKSDSKTRTAFLENWLGREKACPNGYVIDNREMSAEFKVESFEGHCR